MCKKNCGCWGSWEGPVTKYRIPKTKNPNMCSQPLSGNLCFSQILLRYSGQMNKLLLGYFIKSLTIPWSDTQMNKDTQVIEEFMYPTCWDLRVTPTLSGATTNQNLYNLSANNSRWCKITWQGARKLCENCSGLLLLCNVSLIKSDLTASDDFFRYYIFLLLSRCMKLLVKCSARFTSM